MYLNDDDLARCAERAERTSQLVIRSRMWRIEGTESARRLPDERLARLSLTMGRTL